MSSQGHLQPKLRCTGTQWEERPALAAAGPLLLVCPGQAGDESRDRFAATAGATIWHQCKAGAEGELQAAGP